jgi:hypothetical protein
LTHTGIDIYIFKKVSLFAILLKKSFAFEDATKLAKCANMTINMFPFRIKKYELLC